MAQKQMTEAEMEIAIAAMEAERRMLERQLQQQKEASFRGVRHPGELQQEKVQYLQQQITTPSRTSTVGSSMASSVAGLRQELKVSPKAERRLAERERMGQRDPRLDKLKRLINSM